MNASALLLLALASALAQLPASPDPKPMPITGVVVDESDRPVANADVWLAEALPPDEGRRAGMELWYVSLTGPGDGAPPIARPRPERRRRAIRAGGTRPRPSRGGRRRRWPSGRRWTRARRARVAFRRLPRIVLADDPPVRISLGPPCTRAHGPDARSEAGGRRPGRPHPRRRGADPRADRAGPRRVADAAGRAAIAGLEPIARARSASRRRGSASRYWRFKIPGLKIQEYPGKTTRSSILTLAPVGRIAGRLVAPAASRSGA